MRCFVRLIVPGFALAAAVACSVPTDKSTQVYVVVFPSESLSAHGVLGENETDFFVAKAYQAIGVPDTGNVDDVELHNIDFAWSTDQPAVVTVKGSSFGTADVTGKGPGSAEVVAAAKAFQDATPGHASVRVALPFVIDSIRPTSVRYGDTITVYGVGIQNLFILNLGAADLIPDLFSFSGSQVGLGRQSYWVPPPASTDLPFYIGPGFFGRTTDSITVDPQDIFEPDTAVPGVIDINGPGGPRTFGTLPVLFLNPALSFEPVTTGSSDIDWDRFDQSGPQPATILVNSKVFGDTAFAFISDSLLKCGPNPTDICYQPPTGWFFTPGRQACNGTQFFYLSQPRVPTFMVPFKQWPTPRVHLVQFYAKAGGYDLTAVRGYLVPDRAVPPDRFEDNQLCWQADTTFSQSSDSTSPLRKHVVVGVSAGSWGDSTLTISHPLDVDFYRIRFQGGVLTIQSKARPFGTVDPSDIDLYLYDLSGSVLAQSTAVGSNEVISTTQPAGDYYVTVVDVANQPTRYAICVVQGLGCTPPGSAPLARSTAKPHTWVRPGAASAPAFTAGDPRLLLPRR